MDTRLVWSGGNVLKGRLSELLAAVTDNKGSRNIRDYCAREAPALSLRAANGFVVALGPLGEGYTHPFESLGELVVLARINRLPKPEGRVFEFNTDSAPPIYRESAFNKATYFLPGIGPGVIDRSVEDILNSQLSATTYRPGQVFPPQVYLPGLIAAFEDMYPRKRDAWPRLTLL